MMDINGYAALVLVVFEVGLIVVFMRGKTSKGTFISASVPVVFLVSFFWMGGRVTEMTIAGIGTIKTAVNVATQYVEEIKQIKSDMEQQKGAVDEIAKAAENSNRAISDLTKKNELANAQLEKISDQLTQAKSLTDELQQKQDYWETAKLNAVGLSGLIGPDNTLMKEHSSMNDIIGKYVSLQPFSIDCHTNALAAYDAAIAMAEKFPFAYYYRGVCKRGNAVEGWKADFEKAKSIFLITTTIPGHHQNHDEILKLIMDDNMKSNVPPGFKANTDISQ